MGVGLATDGVEATTLIQAGWRKSPKGATRTSAAVAATVRCGAPASTVAATAACGAASC